MLGLMCVAFLSACNKPTVNNPEVNVNNPESNTNVEDNTEVNDIQVENTETHLKTSLSNEDLDELEQILLPISYVYEKYTWTSEWAIDNGEYTYNEWDTLLPSLGTITNREIQSSNLQDDMIYTDTLVTLEDGSQYSLLYVNNPDTLQFVAASVSDSETTALYTFRY